jgi:hypothetical protein
MKKSSRNNRSFTPTIIATLLLVVAVTATRANDLVTDPGPGTPTISSGAMTLGYNFSTGSNAILVTALGIWDQGQDGLANAHTIGLWLNGGGPLIASVTVPAGTGAPLSGQFRFVDLATPIQITGVFIIGASYLASDADAYVSNRSGQQATWDSAIAGIGFAASSAPGTGFAYPDNDDGLGSNVGPNLQFSVVPEPSNWLLFLGGGCLVMIVSALRRQTTHR